MGLFKAVLSFAGILLSFSCVPVQSSKDITVYEVSHADYTQNSILYVPEKIRDYRLREDKVFQEKGLQEQDYAVRDITEDISDYVFGLIEYASDYDLYGKDYWQTSRETLDRGKGDCEDRANLIYVLVSLQGVSQDLVGVVIFRGPEGKQHAEMCVFPEGSRKHFYVYSTLSNLDLYVPVSGYTMSRYWIYRYQ